MPRIYKTRARSPISNLYEENVLGGQETSERSVPRRRSIQDLYNDDSNVRTTTSQPTPPAPRKVSPDYKDLERNTKQEARTRTERFNEQLESFNNKGNRLVAGTASFFGSILLQPLATLEGSLGGFSGIGRKIQERITGKEIEPNFLEKGFRDPSQGKIKGIINSYERMLDYVSDTDTTNDPRIFSETALEFIERGAKEGSRTEAGLGILVSIFDLLSFGTLGRSAAALKQAYPSLSDKFSKLNTLDPNAFSKAIKQQDEAGNIERIKVGKEEVPVIAVSQTLIQRT